MIASDGKPKGQPFQFSEIPQSWTECWPYLVIYVRPQIQVYDRMNQNDTSLQNATSLQNIDIEQGQPNAAVVFAHDSTTTPGKDVAVVATGRDLFPEKEIRKKDNEQSTHTLSLSLCLWNDRRSRTKDRRPEAQTIRRPGHRAPPRR